ncbi:hypothetical protein [Candidatus Nanohalobium constans]|uniref:Uncharacterized protein n=1 Tax=Candidatus Nanohalobium constans TaxID=2565781 RepID=A0A5Q0UGR0_9ARCH|nr:hypothetical protein [Candidatus Nanohalobium constans]QGA80832.1 hypothetical protein LC1Nh_0950 [Candidatus Nanohalobium constans]
MNKGLVTVIIPIFTVVFIGSGTLYSSVMITDSFKETIEYNTGDPAKMSETKLKADLYPEKMRKELNFSINKKVTDNDRTDITGRDNLIQKHKSEVLSHVKTQNRVEDCGKPPINSLNLNNDVYSLVFEEEFIDCSSSSAEVQIPFDASNIRVDKSRTHYIDMLIHSTSVRDNFIEKLPDKQPEYSGDSGGNSCPEDLDDEKEDAREDAENKYENSDLADKHSDALEAASLPPEPVEADSSQDADKSFSTTLKDEETCRYRDGCNSRDKDGRCIEPDYSTGRTYDVSATLTIEGIDGNFKFENEEVDLLTDVDENGDLQYKNPIYRFQASKTY